MLGKTRRVHFIGIGGIGMSGIAELLANLGYLVSGSDEKRSRTTERLTTLGIQVMYGHDAKHVNEADLIVVSSAVRLANPEVLEAKRRHVQLITRGEMLGEIMRRRHCIAVAGAHGKTTTTSMIAFMLERAGLDPTAVIGGVLSAFGSNARLGRGEWMVAEADESDRSFLKLFPTIAVITNIDDEHLENYKSIEDLQQAFVTFANRVPADGMVVACADDPNLAALLHCMARPFVTYGLDAMSCDFKALDVVLQPLGASATIQRRLRQSTDTVESVTVGSLKLRVPGRHNLQNALAAVAVGLQLNLPFPKIAAALEEFSGAERRFDIRGEPNGILVIDDYGHHPTEIKAVLAAAKEFGRRIVVVFQPHRFTRTARLINRFGQAFEGADRLVLMDIYAAGEEPIPGVTVDALATAIRQTGHHLKVDVVLSFEDVVPTVAGVVRRGDIVITLGAGSIASLSEKLIRVLAGTLFSPDKGEGSGS